MSQCDQTASPHRLPLTRNCRTLSAHTLAALADFNADKDAHASKFERLKALAEDDADDDQDAPPLTMDAFTEDWNESQFWVRPLPIGPSNTLHREGGTDCGSTPKRQPGFSQRSYSTAQTRT